jgi:hypothetical protein
MFRRNFRDSRNHARRSRMFHRLARPAESELFDRAVAADVLIVCIDDADAARNTSALKILDRCEKAD